jgi:hypothetical protein
LAIFGGAPTIGAKSILEEERPKSLLVASLKKPALTL